MKTILMMILACIFIFPSGQTLNNEIEALDLESKNYILYSLDSESVIASKNKDTHLSVGSINKILTVYTSLDYIKDEDLDIPFVIEAHMLENMPEGISVADFKVGQTVTLRDVLYGILLPSGGDAIMILTHRVFGSDEHIVEAMNKKAQELGMVNTHIVNQIGLDDEDQYTTLEDFLLLLRIALKNELFYELYTSTEYTLTHEGITIFDGILTQVRDLENPYIKGAKSGFTLNAGRALSTLASDGETSYIMISTQATGEYYVNNGSLKDAITVYDYLFPTFAKQMIVKDNQDVGVMKVKYVYDSIELKIPEEVIAIIERNYDKESVAIEYVVIENLKAPLAKGSELATYTVKVNDEVYYEGVIVSDVDLNPDYIDQMIWFGVLTILLGIAGLLFLIVKKRK